jgi:hypothetical protein
MVRWNMMDKNFQVTLYAFLRKFGKPTTLNFLSQTGRLMRLKKIIVMKESKEEEEKRYRRDQDKK